MKDSDLDLESLTDEELVKRLRLWCISDMDIDDMLHNHQSDRVREAERLLSEEAIYTTAFGPYEVESVIRAHTRLGVLLRSEDEVLLKYLQLLCERCNPPETFCCNFHEHMGYD